MSITVGITGAYGFLGWHLRCFLHSHEVSDVHLAGRETFSSPHELAEFVRDCDVIFHFAGVNRAKDENEIAEVNPALAQKLVDALESSGSKPFIVYSSSMHADGDSVYGHAKKSAGDVIQHWADRVGAEAATIVYPHLYGECGKPFYNSVVHTFCHQLAMGDDIKVNGDGDLYLLHAQDAAEYAWSVFENQRTGEIRPNGRQLTVSELGTMLRSYYESYSNGVIPDLREPEDRKLFNVLRTAMYPSRYPMMTKRNEDPRGWLFEAVREENGGQIFVSSTNFGYTRGNHYHRFKVERFCVLQGDAIIRIRRLFSDDTQEFNVSGDKPCFIDMPPLHTHSIENTGKEQVFTLFWSNEFFDPDRPDTYPEPVIPERS